MAPKYPVEGAELASSALSKEQKNRWRQACWDIFQEFLGNEEVVFFAPTDAELDEVVTTSNELAGEFGMTVPREKWMIYADLGRYMISEKHVKNRRAALAAIVINSMTFFWDDVDDCHLDKQHLVLKKTREICERYYKPEYRDFVFAHIRQWIDTDTFSRRHPQVRENICLKHGVTTYWQFRLIDSGCPFWYGITGPCYESAEFLMMSATLAHFMLKPIMVVNDIYSYAREEKVNENANFLNQTKGLDAAGKEALVKEHLDAMRHDLKTLVEEFDEPLKGIMLLTSFGNLAGSAVSVRYNSD